MRNLLLSLLVVTAVACKGKSEPPAPAPAAPGSNTPEKRVGEVIRNETPIAVPGAPAECDAYKAAIDKLPKCTALDVAARAKLRHAYNESAEKWATATDKGALAQQCKDGLTALEAAAKAPCGW